MSHHVKQMAIVLPVISVLLLSVSLTSGGMRERVVNKNACTASACNGHVIVDADDGTIVGCDSNCSGKCQRCTGGTATRICVYAGVESDICRVANGETNSCSKALEYPCAGTSPNCVCATTGGQIPGTDLCKEQKECV